MERGYEIFYQQVYGHLLNFCLSGDYLSIKAIQKMDMLSYASDRAIKKTWELLNNFKLPITDGFKNAFEDYKSIRFDELSDQWWRAKVLYLFYVYIIPRKDAAKIQKDQILSLEEKIVNQGQRLLSLKLETDKYAISKHIEKEITVKDVYMEDYEQKRDFRLKDREFLVVLKGFSSSTPFFYSALKENFFNNSPIRGGGLFIKWGKKGIVIDPGINFLENFHAAQLSVNDIDAIIITHDHIDHNGDISVIADMLYQLGDKKVALYLDKQSYNKIKKSCNLEANFTFYIVDPRQNTEYLILEQKNIRMKVLSNKHIFKDERKKKYSHDSYSVKLYLGDAESETKIFGFTSDTAYFDRLSYFLSDCDYIIANISETNKNDYWEGQMKDNHLGYTGCLKLIQRCREKKSNINFIISEFWAGKGDIRVELIQSLRKDASYNNIYAGDIGNIYFLDQSTFLCGNCKTEDLLKNIHIVKTGDAFSNLSAICHRCILCGTDKADNNIFQ